MSDSEQLQTESDEEAALPKKVIRTVTPGYRGKESPEMDSVGWAIFLGMGILLLPFLPVIIAVWAVSKLLDYGRRTEK